jgi:hypothetical protein
VPVTPEGKLAGELEPPEPPVLPPPPPALDTTFPNDEFPPEPPMVTVCSSDGGVYELVFMT